VNGVCKRTIDNGGRTQGKWVRGGGRGGEVKKIKGRGVGITARGGGMKELFDKRGEVKKGVGVRSKADGFQQGKDLGGNIENVSPKTSQRCAVWKGRERGKKH